MNIVLSDPKEGKAYGKKTEEAAFIGKKLGETVSLEAIGLKGYKAVIAGGSDKDGFPMKPSVEGQSRKKLVMAKGIGIKNMEKGEKRRKRVRGNTVAKDIHQLNLKITEYGPDKLSDIFKKPAAEKKEGEAAEAEAKHEKKEHAEEAKHEKKEHTEEAKHEQKDAHAEGKEAHKKEEKK